MSIPTWANSQFFHAVINFHLYKLLECEYKDAAVFHWRQILYYHDEIEHEIGGDIQPMEKLYEDCKTHAPNLARMIENYDLLNEKVVK